MKHIMKPITRQLAIAALILISVTVMSFGIRQVRFSIYRAKNIENSMIAEAGESTASARSSDPKDQLQPKQSLGANTEPNYYLIHCRNRTGLLPGRLIHCRNRT